MSKEDDSFDLIVIGAGPGGLRAAIISAIQGRKTAIIEPADLGGVCVNFGCIPFKSMLNVASIYHDTNYELKKFGITVSKPKIDFSKLMGKVNSIIKADQEDIRKKINNKNLTWIKERASFTSNNTIKAGNKIYSAKKILIATGAKPHVPTIKGIDKVDFKVSDDVLKLKALPKSVIMIGAGYISMELSTFFHDLGSKVTVLEKAPAILSNFDEEVSKLLAEQYEKEKMDIFTSVDIQEIKQKGNAKIVNYNTGNKKYTVKADSLFIIAGRMPNTFGLNLESAGIKKGSRGEIIVNEKLQTSNPDVFAIGDVNARSFFANIAQREGEMVLENMFNNASLSFDPLMVPWATGTRPKLAHAGLTENDAKKKNIDFKVIKVDMSESAGAEVMGYEVGFVKVIIDKSSHKLLGCTIVSPHSEIMIHEFAALLNMNATLEDLKKIMHVHPTLSEIFNFIR